MERNWTKWAIILAAAVVWGAWKGLAWQVASLASVVLSYIVALYFRQPLTLSRTAETSGMRPNTRKVVETVR